MSSPFLAEIRLLACNFPPKGWALCNGQLLPINQNQALFSLLGTVYGGNGVTTFALPDLRGRVAVHFGQGNGLSSYSLGQAGGEESVRLNVNQLPAHNHPVACNNTTGSQADPQGNFPGPPTSSSAALYSATANSTMASGMLSNTGGQGPHENRQPLLALQYCIAIIGIYPSRT